MGRGKAYLLRLPFSASIQSVMVIVVLAKKLPFHGSINGSACNNSNCSKAGH